MKIRFFILAMSLLLVTPFFTQADSRHITGNDAENHFGENQVVCGTIKQVKVFNKGVYFNIGERFPRQSITFILWERDAENFNRKYGSPFALTNMQYCASGIIKAYKDKPQIHLYEQSGRFNLFLKT